MIWIVISICITLTIWFVLAAKIYYDLRINKEFTVKAGDINSLICQFRSMYLEGYSKETKYLGKGMDIKNLIDQINAILTNKQKIV